MKRWRIVALMNYGKTSKKMLEECNRAWEILITVPEYIVASKNYAKLKKNKTKKAHLEIKLLENKWGDDILCDLQQQKQLDAIAADKPLPRKLEEASGQRLGFLCTFDRYIQHFDQTNYPIVDFEHCDEFSRGYFLTKDDLLVEDSTVALKTPDVLWDILVDNNYIYETGFFQKKTLPVHAFDNLDYKYDIKKYLHKVFKKKMKENEVIAAPNGDECKDLITLKTQPVTVDLYYPKTYIDKRLRSGLISIKRTFKPKKREANRPRYYKNMECTSDGKLSLDIDLGYPIGEIVETVIMKVEYYKKKQKTKNKNREKHHHLDFLSYLLCDKVGIKKSKIKKHLIKIILDGSPTYDSAVRRDYKNILQYFGK